MIERFKKIRRSFDWTQEEFAIKLETNKQSITDIENGRKGINTDILEKLHQNLSINLNWLISGSGKMKLSYNEPSIVSEPLPDYGNIWKTLAEERKERIDELKAENERLKANLKIEESLTKK